MLEVTSSETVLVLSDAERKALTKVLFWYRSDYGLRHYPELYDLYEALGL